MPSDPTNKQDGPIPDDASPARESLSWIRALASQWEEDRASPAGSEEAPGPPAE